MEVKSGAYMYFQRENRSAKSLQVAGRELGQQALELYLPVSQPPECQALCSAHFMPAFSLS